MRRLLTPSPWSDRYGYLQFFHVLEAGVGYAVVHLLQRRSGASRAFHHLRGERRGPLGGLRVDPLVSFEHLDVAQPRRLDLSRFQRLGVGRSGCCHYHDLRSG